MTAVGSTSVAWTCKTLIPTSVSSGMVAEYEELTNRGMLSFESVTVTCSRALDTNSPSVTSREREKLRCPLSSKSSALLRKTMPVSGLMLNSPSSFPLVMT